MLSPTIWNCFVEILFVLEMNRDTYNLKISNNQKQNWITKENYVRKKNVLLEDYMIKSSMKSWKHSCTCGCVHGI